MVSTEFARILHRGRSRREPLRSWFDNLTTLSLIEGRPMGLYLSKVQFVQIVPIVLNVLNGLNSLNLWNLIFYEAHSSIYSLPCFCSGLNQRVSSYRISRIRMKTSNSKLETRNEEGCGAER
jgi:hypothetical protein